MSGLGLALLALVGLLMVTTGLPAYVVLLFAATIGAIAAVGSGQVPVEILGALPSRLVNLLESDLLQALPLFVLMGALLNRIAVVPALFKTLVWLLPRRPGARPVAGLALGALLGPMSGSVGASVLALSRTVEPSLAASGVGTAQRHALIAVASTFGVVIPPSLVLILLGDAMLSAHTLAVNATGRQDRIVNTQDILRGALVPAALFVLACLVVAWFAAARAGGDRDVQAVERPSLAEAASSVVAVAFLVALLGGVATGYFYAVEAAAAGAVVLFVLGIATGKLGRGVLGAMLSEVLATTGALFAPLLAATTFTLTLRILGTDKLIEAWVAALPGGEIGAIAIVLAAMALLALVLDAFELIFVAVPILIPPLLMRTPDAIWVSALVLLTLQLSFLMPPAGYALMMTRGILGPGDGLGALTRRLAPFLAIQILVLATILAFPRLVHLLDPPNMGRSTGPVLDKDEIEKRLRDIPMPGLPGLPPGLGGAPPKL